MPDPTLAAADLVARIAELEHQHRRLKLLGLTFLALTSAALAGFAPRAAPVVQAERVELVTAQGARRASLAADSLGVALMLFDTAGRPTSSLRLNGEPRLAVLTGTGREVAGLGWPRAQNLTQ